MNEAVDSIPQQNQGSKHIEILTHVSPPLLLPVGLPDGNHQGALLMLPRSFPRNPFRLRRHGPICTSLQPCPRIPPPVGHAPQPSTLAVCPMHPRATFMAALTTARKTSSST